MTPCGERVRWTALFLFLALPATRAFGAPPDAAAFDAILDGAFKTWRAPGIAAVVVRDDEVIYLRGAGVRELGKNDPVTPDTVFELGPLTEGFTATALTAAGGRRQGRLGRSGSQAPVGVPPV